MTKLLNFTVGNFRSFGEKRTFTFLTDKRAGRAGKGTFKAGPYRLSVISACYGANSGGKSNLVDAMALMKDIIVNNSKLSSVDKIKHMPFALDEKSINEPQTFELTFYNDELGTVRYGFSNTAEKIVKEWLFIKKDGKGNKERPYFLRSPERIAVDADLLPDVDTIIERTNPNRLFLIALDANNIALAQSIFKAIHTDINIISGLDNEGYGLLTAQTILVQHPIGSQAKEFFQDLDLGFDDVIVRKEQEADNRLSVYSVHSIFDESGFKKDTKPFPFEAFESAGTKKIFELAAPILDTLNRGAVLVVDELDAKLHPYLTREIVYRFIKEETNSNHAQLFFTTHLPTLLSSKLLRADQMWFVEKDRLMRSDLYRATDMVLPDGEALPPVRDPESFFLAGRYGGVPNI
mgnify:CR=1 FL=1